jgi:hypothetical protein
VTRHAAAEAPISFGGGGVKMRPRFRFFLEVEFPFNVRVQRELFTDNAHDFDPEFERTSPID